ncbi:hypothetical protein BXO88_09930 [Oribacterium sp. C9]|uniref:hypothetical protein n=1 Tax=Oribacterium sp. C9 TaxID=1943579 RepID=UPI00098FC5A5|nr:hypothetical protein [Oribacterium sp. C9]OON85935.1 hypothetical protein BXO88_09930 [Oribacterium sp. C9]
MENSSIDNQFDSFYKKIQEINRQASEYKPYLDVDEDDISKVFSNACDYNSIEKIERSAKAHRHEIVNNLIESLLKPLSNEQESKNFYRKVILIVFSFFFLGVTVVTFVLLFIFSQKGFNKYTVEVSNILITGLFVNIVGLAVIIFKYLFDDKNSLLKDMIQLIANTLKGDYEKDNSGN